MSLDSLQNLACTVRQQIVQLSHTGKTPHLGSSLSCVDLMTVLYAEVLNLDPKDPKNTERDRFILSKGHGITTQYALLAELGFFPKAELQANYAKDGHRLPEHPAPNCVPGIEAATGSLGHGLSIAAGIALSAKIKGQKFHSYVLASDGELNEGSVWEAALWAPKQHLDNLTLIVDFNKWQATGRSAAITQLEPLEEKFKSFGWYAQRIDGHDFSQILGALGRCSPTPGHPKVIIADTVKGKGVDFMQDDNNWHYRIPNEEEVAAAHKQIEATRHA